MQILANRLSLILYNPVRSRRLKMGLGIAIAIINVSVFCIWIPARLQISTTWIRVNDIWDRTEKAVFACIDTSLNVYFMWLVKSKLVEGGLTQYKLVYQVNLVLVWLSISLDVSPAPSTVKPCGALLTETPPKDFAHWPHVSPG